MKQKIKALSNALYGTAIAVISPGDIPTLTPKGGSLSPEKLVTNVISWILWFLGALAVVFVIYGGILYITSGGDAEKTKKARDTLLYAIIGVIIIILAIAIVRWAAGFAQGR